MGKSQKSGKDSDEAVDTPKTNTSTELSKHIWKLKNANKEFTIKWKIQCLFDYPHTPGTNFLKKCADNHFVRIIANLK